MTVSAMEKPITVQLKVSLLNIIIIDIIFFLVNDRMVGRKMVVLCSADEGQLKP